MGAVPTQDGVGGDDQVKLPQHRSGESVKQCGKERPVGTGVERGLLAWRCRTASWWRSVKISMFLSVLLIGSKRRNVTMPVRAR
jgi:hypothetical protein